MHRFLFGVFFLVTSAFAQDPSRMDEIVKSYVTQKQFMGSVLVARGDHVLFNKGYGFADLEKRIPDTTETKFEIGSITKQFTAAAILLLQEKGLLQIRNPINKYLPDVPAAWNGIAIYHLLTHTSGSPEMSGFPELQKTKAIAHTAAYSCHCARGRCLHTGHACILFCRQICSCSDGYNGSGFIKCRPFGCGKFPVQFL
jgi:CubicO group peptidase (beta-lactamase class C family)